MYTLIIVTLNVKSSYINDVEKILGANNVPDTIQFWLEYNKSIVWRIRTFAIDHDIHISKMDFKNIKDKNLPSFLIEITTKNYGDILQSIKILNFSNLENKDLIKEVFKTNDLELNLEINQNFAFRNPDNKKYRTQSSHKS